MRRLLEPVRPEPLALALLALAALGVLVAGFQHARLFHRGYAEVEIVGLLFFMNAIGSTVVVLTLIASASWMFVLGALSICVPSLVSIAISHSSIGFLGFREGGYDADALVIVAAEVRGGRVRAGRRGGGRRAGAARGGAHEAVRAPLALVVVASWAARSLGIGMGEAPAEREAAPAAAQVAAARERIAAGGADVRRGRALFDDEGCDRCHAIAAIGAERQARAAAGHDRRRPRRQPREHRRAARGHRRRLSRRSSCRRLRRPPRRCRAARARGVRHGRLGGRGARRRGRRKRGP